MSPEQRARKKQRFLKMYRETANIKASCEASGISRRTFYNWRDADEDFCALLRDADEDANDSLEYAAYDRAVLGVPSYVVFQGRIVYEDVPVFLENGDPKLDKDGNQVSKRGKPLIERKYSDNLLTTRLKARMPEKYKDKQQIDTTVQHSGMIDIGSDLRMLSDEQLQTFKSWVQSSKAGTQ